MSKDRVFSAPDGQKYRWILGARVPSLFREDGSDTAIAIYHRPTLFGQYKSEKVRLEIFPEGQNMVDLILVTFVCIEMLRLQLRGHSTDLRQAKSSEAFKVQGDT
ncbi:hypothetical protein C8J56DRAFT_949614 [Mycena floridula]|nr:hypothetical protein C8J56DRAFT_949614 [Mycena floridula]